MHLLAAMAPPGGGRSAFSARLMAVFSPVNVEAPSDRQLRRIFGAMLHTKLAEFNDEVRGRRPGLEAQGAGGVGQVRLAAADQAVCPCHQYDSARCAARGSETLRRVPPARTQVRPLGDPLIAASVELYRAISHDMLPTPAKSHYLFNTRDLAKLVLGVMQVGGPWGGGLLSKGQGGRRPLQRLLRRGLSLSLAPPP
jgi:hypothetical protein